MSWLLYVVFFIALLFTVNVSRAAEPSSDDLATVRERIVASYLEGSPPRDDVKRWVDTLRDNGTWPDIDYENQVRAAWPMSEHLTRIVDMVHAYKTPQLARQTPKLRAAMFSALDHWLENDYRNPNWWWNEIGTPRLIARCALPLADELSQTQREQVVSILSRSEIGRTGQNLVWLSENAAARGLLTGDGELLERAFQRIAEEVHITTDEGVQPDYSFHQHGAVLYNHGYGAGFATDTTRIAGYVTGTSLAWPQDKIDLLASYVLDGSQWMTHRHMMDYGAGGRNISRPGLTAHYLKGAARNLLALPTGREDELKALIARIDGDGLPLIGNKYFWRSDIMCHHREGWYASARMHSTRLDNTDQPSNDEGILSHHISDGCNYLLRTGNEYRDIFPVWDWQKIPGTTVTQDDDLEGTPRRTGTTDFVGGVSDEKYGAAAMHLTRDSLNARKAWFFFDDGYVCLGSEITSKSGDPVATTLNQCLLNGDVRASLKGDVQSLKSGERALDDADWVWHDQVAYVPLDNHAMQLHFGERKGSWHRISLTKSEDAVTKGVFTLWLDHGSKPKNASYAYAVLPDVPAKAGEIDRIADRFDILVNSAEVQAVRHRETGIVQAVFYNSGLVVIGDEAGLSATEPCIVQWRPKQQTIAVADPTQQVTQVSIELRGPRFRDALADTLVDATLPTEEDAGKTVVYEVKQTDNESTTP